MKNLKLLTVIILLSLTIVLSFAFPRGIKYEATKFLPGLQLPYTIADWQGKDVNVGIGATDKRYNFVGEVLGRKYTNRNGENLLLLILNARDFHYPNVCFTSSGFKVRELNKTELSVSGRTFKVHTIYTERGRKNERYLVLYWIVIDQKMIHNWTEQKIKQLFFSLFNKKSAGLMVRLDIPVGEDTVENGLILAKQFTSGLGRTISPENADYIFGQKKPH